MYATFYGWRSQTGDFGANTLKVNVNGSASICDGSNANCNVYDWDWGDGSAHGITVVTNHTYATAGAKTISSLRRICLPAIPDGASV